MITLALTLLALPQVELNDQQTKLVNALIQVESNGKDDAVGDNGNAIGCLQIWKIYHTDATERSNIGGVYRDCFQRDYAVLVFDAYMRRYARSAWTDPLKFDAEKVARIHNGGPKGYKKKATEKYWKKVKILLDMKRGSVYNGGIMENISYYDSSYSPNEACEASDIPNCGACYDSGMIVDQDVYCDCAEGDLMAEIDADFRAEAHAERCFTDHGYARDCEHRNDDPELW